MIGKALLLKLFFIKGRLDDKLIILLATSLRPHPPITPESPPHWTNYWDVPILSVFVNQNFLPFQETV